MSFLSRFGMNVKCHSNFFLKDTLSIQRRAPFSSNRFSTAWTNESPLIPITIGGRGQVSYVSRYQFRNISILQREANCIGEGSVLLTSLEKVVRVLSERREEKADFKISKESLSGGRIPIRGGTCTAMSLDFIDRYLSWSKGRSPLDFTIFSRKFGSRYKICNDYFKTLQNGFNGLTLDQSLSPEEFQNVKMQSLGNYFDLKARSESGILNFSSNNLFMLRQDFERAIAKLSDGAHLLRIIRPDESAKKEKYGHSCVLIRNGDDLMYYDPCGGIFQLKVRDTLDLFHLILPAAKNSSLSLGRFYEFSHKTAI